MTTKINELTYEELKIIIQEMIDEKVQELVSDPDEGLALRESILRKLKENKSLKRPRVAMSSVMKKYGYNMK